MDEGGLVPLVGLLVAVSYSWQRVYLRWMALKWMRQQSKSLMSGTYTTGGYEEK